MRYLHRVTFSLALFVLLTGTISSAEELRVMTRNQYLGADLGPVLSASTPAAFGAAVLAALNQIAANDFPQRAELLASEIAEKRPHLVGLQEVFAFTLNGATSAPPFRDHLTDLLQALAAVGADYYVAAQVFNLNVTIPLPGLGLVQALDRDVILVRRDVPAWPVPLLGMCRLSGQGCNFRVVATLTSPVGPIRIERGFVVVEALIGTRPVRFVNTHLEVPELPRAIQAAQATELITVLSNLPTQPGTPTIVAGDFNSAPNDEESVTNGAPIVPPYLQLTRAAFADIWPLRPGNPPGYTCCQLSDLSHAESLLFKRVDLIFTDMLPDDVKANVVGADSEEKTAFGLWPSDHAGVFARLSFLY